MKHQAQGASPDSLKSLVRRVLCTMTAHDMPHTKALRSVVPDGHPDYWAVWALTRDNWAEVEQWARD